jgi:DNA repair protein RAD5
LRRTKRSQAKDGKSILELPEKNIKIEYVDLSVEEKNIYDALFNKSKVEFDDLLSKGMLLSNYAHIFEIILRLRQVCDHPFLIYTRNDVVGLDKLEKGLEKFLEQRLNENFEREEQEKALLNNHSHFEPIVDEESNRESVLQVKRATSLNRQFFEKTIEKIKNNEVGKCPICLDEEIDDAVVTVCLHIMCRLCLTKSIENSMCCPICRTLVTKEDFMTVPRCE